MSNTIDDLDALERRLVDARRAEAETSAEYRRIMSRQAELEGRRIEESGERVVDIDCDGVLVQFSKLDSIELAALKAKAERESLDCGETLLAARRATKAALRDRANGQLPAAIDEWRVKDAAARRAMKVLEAAYGACVAATVQVANAQTAERAAAGRVNRIAASAGDRHAEEVKGLDLSRQVATMLDDRGIAETADRSDLGWFGDDDAPDFGSTGRLLAVAYNDPTRLLGELRGTRLGKAAGL